MTKDSQSLSDRMGGEIPAPEYTIEFRLAAGYDEKDVQDVFERVLGAPAVNGAALVCLIPGREGLVDFERPNADG